MGMLLLFAGASTAHAQDTIISMPEFVKTDTQTRHVEGGYYYRLDSLAELDRLTLSNLSEALTSETSIHIKSYGPGLLSTPSFRGGDANHTIVMWNGAKLNSPMLGHTDLSLIPVSQFNSIDVFTGSSSNLYSTGGIGGGVSLNQQPDLQKRSATVSVQAGSFGERGFAAKTNTPFKIARVPFALDLSVESLRRKNNFPYLDISQPPYEQRIMQHASVVRSNAMVSIAAMPSPDWSLQASYWFTEAARELPNPINLSYPSGQMQEDTAHRAQLMVEYKPAKRLRFKLLSMLEDNVIRFVDPRTDIDNANRFTAFQSQLDMAWVLFPTLELKAIVNGMVVNARSGNYTGLRSLQSMSALLTLKKTLLQNRLVVEAGSRAERYLGYVGGLPFAGMSWLPSRQSPVKFLASYAQTFRMPTLNELYWNPGGNPDLEPERGTTFEAGFASNGTGEKEPLLEYKVVYFSGNYTGRIRWLPRGPQFSPLNVAQSHVQGVDLVAGTTLRTGKLKSSPGLNLSYTKAVGKLNTASELQALSYTPQWAFALSLQVVFGGVNVHYVQNYTGKRFITNDESAYMPAYSTGTLTCVYNMHKHTRVPFSVGLCVDNLWDVNYQNLPWRPMPGRSFTAMLKYHLT